MVNKIKNLLKGFKKIWAEKENKDELTEIMVEKLFKNDKEIIKEKYEGFLDNANIMAIIPKKTSLKKLIRNNFEVKDTTKGKEETLELINSLNYFSDGKEEITSDYSEEFLTIIFNLIKGYEKVKIKTKKDYALWVEVSDFICILAPRVEEKKNDR